jgi:cytochrome c oxidase cbb3-type subunit 3
MSNRAPIVTLFLSLMASPALAEDQFAGIAKIYDTYCAQCHGINRMGTGINSKVMSVQPRDHTDPKAMGDTSDEALFKAIKEGGLAVNKSILMPSWKGVLNDSQIKEMVAYLRFVSKTTNK